MRAIAKEIGLITHFKLAQFPNIEKELLRIDEVCVHVCVSGWVSGVCGGVHVCMCVIVHDQVISVSN